MTESNIHEELTMALRLFKLTLKDWAASRKKPDGSVGVTPSMVLHCAQGREDTAWLRSDIETLISKAHKTFPDFYDFHERKAVTK